MNMTPEMIRPSRPTAAAVRDEILAQHSALRRFLEEVAAAARATGAGDESSGRSLCAMCMRLRSRFERHLAFEEATLVPALRQTDPWGVERARRLVDEHARQRQELSTLVALGQMEHDARTVAFVLQTLVSDILIDMEHEERELLVPEVLRDDLIVLDQASD